MNKTTRKLLCPNCLIKIRQDEAKLQKRRRRRIKKFLNSVGNAKEGKNKN